MREIIRDALGFESGSAGASPPDAGQQRLFGVWWRTCKPEVRTAMILTAVSELPEVLGGEESRILLPVVAPEFQRPGNYVHDVELLPTLLDLLVHGRENDKDVHSFDGFFEDEEGDQPASVSTFEAPVGADSLLLLRSNLLLSFGSSVVTIWLREAEDAADTITP